MREVASACLSAWLLLMLIPSLHSLEHLLEDDQANTFLHPSNARRLDSFGAYYDTGDTRWRWFGTHPFEEAREPGWTGQERSEAFVDALYCNIGAYRYGNECRYCPGGQYSDIVSRETMCKTCPPGWFHTSISTSCEKCPPGQFRSGNDAVDSCKYCPEGYINSLEANFECFMCIAALGHFMDQTGSSATVCKSSCPIGYKFQAFDSPCSLCLQGFRQTVSTNNVQICEKCTVGKHQNEKGKVTCNECAAGKYTDENGKPSCSNCQAEDASLQDKTGCKHCPIGWTHGGAQVECQACGQGKAAPDSMSACVMCPTGWYQDKDQATASACTSCAQGMYSTNVLIPCTACAPGSRQPLRGKDACEFCGPGKYSANSESHECTNCPEGTWHNDSRATAYGDQNVCKLCPAGKAVSDPQQGRTKCFDCQIGKYHLAPSREIHCISCQPGTGYSGPGSPCAQCAIGRYQDEDTPNKVCKNCPAGFYGTSLTDCTLCHNYDKSEVANTPYQDEAGKWDCKHCPAGQASGDELEAGLGCKLCVAGKRRDFGLNHYGCVTCSQGRYMDLIGSSASECKKCSKGYFLKSSNEPSNHDSIEDCIPCEPMTFNADLGQSSCLPCPDATEPASTNCSGCIPGRAGSANTSCRDCQPGKFSDFMNLPECKTCPAGFYSESQLLSKECKPCNRGRFGKNPEQSIEKSCEACHAGRYSSKEALGGDAMACEPCPAGRYGTENGTTDETMCKPCSIGKYSSLEGASHAQTCIGCNAGRYSDTFGATSSSECKQCPKGYSNSFANASYCIPCLPGRYQPSIGATMCFPCPVDTFSRKQGNNISCLKCPEGRSSLREGGIVCSR